jgi:hypothetical protein
MQDLILAFIGMLLASIAVGALTIRYSRAFSQRATTACGVLVGAGMIFYVKELWGKALLAALIPHSALIIWGNWFPLSAAFLVGITWTHGYGSRLRRVLFGLAVYLVSLYSVIEPFLGEAPQCRDAWIGPACLQTSPETCSAAAASTLLARHRVAAQESEMAQLCLTRAGTTWLGLYRGLMLKTEGRGLKVDVFECSADTVLTDFRGPAVLSVGLPDDRPFPQWYVDEWGWQVGIRHSVVLLEILPNGSLIVADPAVGIELWTKADLEILWLGRGIRLLPLEPHQ